MRDSGVGNPSIPVALGPDATIRFGCHPGVSCFNACCRQADVTLTPYDILRLARRLGLSSSEFLGHYTVPFEIDADGLPGVKLKTDDAGTCLLLAGEAGCGVYADRPTMCRYYPLAQLALREQGAAETREGYCLVREAHCKGHEEDRRQRIADYRAEQGCEHHDASNREWYELLLKKRSAGPTVGRPSQTSLRLFFAASYDLDAFRRFVLGGGFRAAYALPEDLYRALAIDDEALLRFAFRFLRQALFGERTIPEVPGAWEARAARRREVWQARGEAEIARRLAEEDQKYAGPSEDDCGDN